MRLIDTAWGVSVLVKLPYVQSGGLAAVLPRISLSKASISSLKVFYDLRLDLRFVW
jgi:hypothetical protein